MQRIEQQIDKGARSETIENLIEKAVSIIQNEFKHHDILILIPPGSCRIEIADKLKKREESISTITYRDYKKDEDLVKAAWKEKEKDAKRKVLIVPKDTISAIRIAKQLKSEKINIALFNVAHIYQNNLDGVENYLKLNYGSLRTTLEKDGLKIIPGCEGVSLTLLNRGSADVARLIKSLTDQTEFSSLEVIAEFLGIATGEFVKVVLTPFIFLQIPSLFTNIMSRITQLLTKVHFIKLVREFSNRLKDEEKRREFKDLFITLLRVAKSLEELKEKDPYEGILDYAAFKLGLTLDELWALLHNIYTFLSKDVKTQIDPERLTELSEYKLSQLDEHLDLYEVVLNALGIYMGLDSYKYIKLRDDKFYVTNGTEEVMHVVTQGYSALSEKIINQLEERGIVILKGSSGSGKSILAHYVVARIFRDHRYKKLSPLVYLVRDFQGEKKDILDELVKSLSKIQAPILVVFDPTPPELYTGEAPSIVDSSQKFEERIIMDVYNLLNKVQNWRNKAPPGTLLLLVVLSTSIYELVRSGLEGFFKKHNISGDLYYLAKKVFEENTIDFDEEMTRDRKEFVELMLKTYSGCNDVNVLVNRIIKIEGSHALIAKSVGELLRNNSCIVQEIDSVLEKIKEKDVLRFIIEMRLGLLSGLLPELPASEEVSKEKIKKYARVLALREPFISIIRHGDYIASPGVMSYLLMWISEIQDTKEINRNAVWLSMRNEDLIEKILLDILREAKNNFQDDEILKYCPGDDRCWIIVLDKVGNRIVNKIDEIVEQDIICWQEVANVSGAILSGIEFKQIKHSPHYHSLSEVIGDSRRCDKLRELLLINDEIPPFVRELFLLWIIKNGKNILKPIQQTCRMIGDAREMLQHGDNIIYLYPYFLGLALTALESKDCLDDVMHIIYPVLNVLRIGVSRLYLKIVLNFIENKLKNKNPALLIPILFLHAHYLRDETAENIEFISMLAKKIYDEHKSRLKPWEKAALSNLLAILSLFQPQMSEVEEYFRYAEALSHEIASENRALARLLGSILLVLKALMHNLQGDIKSALKILNMIDQEIEKIEKAMQDLANEYDRGDVTEFLGLYNPIRPTLSNVLKSIQALKTLLVLDILSKVDQQEIKTLLSEIDSGIRRVCEMLKESGACEYLWLKLTLLKLNIVYEPSDSLDVEKFYEELKALLSDAERMACLREELRAHAWIAIISALRGDINSRSISILDSLKEFNPLEWLVTRLLLSVIGPYEKVDDMLILEALFNYKLIEAEFRPAFLYVRGLETNNEELVNMAFNEYAERFSSYDQSANNFLRLGLLVFEDWEKFKEIVLNYIERVYISTETSYLFKELKTLIEQDHNILVKILATDRLISRFISILDDLTKNNYTSAMALALFSCVGNDKSSELFLKLYRALKSIKKMNSLTDDVKLALVKLYLYFF